MPIGAAVGLGELDSFVDDDAVWRFGPVFEFMGRQQQDRMLDRRQLIDAARQKRCEAGLERVPVVDAPPQEFDEKFAIGLVETADLGEMRLDAGGRVVRQQPLVDALQGEFAGAPPCRLAAHLSARIRLAISTAACAQSLPFSRMRTSAWSSSSVVSTPLAIGTPVSSVTRVMPLPISFETSSK